MTTRGRWAWGSLHRVAQAKKEKAVLIQIVKPAGLAHGSEMPGLVRQKDIAERAGVSVATVSLALSDSPRLPAATKSRLRALAEKLGYQAHPYVSAYMSWRRTRGALQLPTVALLHGYAPDTGWKRHGSPTVREMYRGALQQLRARGYAAEEFRLGSIRTPRLVSILQARGTAGLVFAPNIDAAAHYGFPWDDFSAIQIGAAPAGLTLPRVAHDHYQGSLDAVRQCATRGYRRPGLVIDPAHDVRLQHVWRAGFEMGAEECGFAQNRIFRLKETAPDAAALRTWIRQRKPDVIVTNLHQLVEKLLAQSGLSIPKDLGLVSLSVPAPGDRVSGINQNGHLIGVQAIDLLAGSLQLHRTGLLSEAITTLVSGRWNAGETF